MQCRRRDAQCMAVFVLENSGRDLQSRSGWSCCQLSCEQLPAGTQQGPGGHSQGAAQPGGLCPVQGSRELPPLCPALLHDDGTGHGSVSCYCITTDGPLFPTSLTEL
ncbi:hypothetical protein EK904_005883 [Melospiza melodia maxima]|nr:hypothetical protein EK904_005883 [Melospiza melodia maxima]